MKNNAIKNKLVLIFILHLIATKFALSQSFTNSPDAIFIQNNYSKSVYQIEMRDGVKLYTVVYTPLNTFEEYPILLTRTPYSVAPYDENRYKDILGPSIHFTYDYYIFVYQDVRGTYMSEGTFENMRPYIPNKSNNEQTDESTDAWDTIDWLIKNIPHNNGKVGMWGISYPGFYATMALIDAHPALKISSPQAPIADWYWDDFHHNGALFIAHMFDFMYSFGKERKALTTVENKKFVHNTKDGYDFYLNEVGPLKNINEKYYNNEVKFWNDAIKHPNYDEFWKARNILPHLVNIKPAVLVTGGTYDAEDLYGSLNIYKTIAEKNPENDNYFVFGPWIHGGWARTDGNSFNKIQFKNYPTPSAYYLNNIELPLFNHYLKDEEKPSISETNVFDTGSKKWFFFHSWPPNSIKSTNIYLLPDEKLSFKPSRSNVNQNKFIEFESDPSDPVPATTYISTHMPKEYMIEDQRFLSYREDVLKFKTTSLNKDIAFAGEIEVELYVSTTAEDSDWIVKLIDVYPQKEDNGEKYNFSSLYGYQQMVRSEIIRGRYRNSFENPEPFIPNEITKVSFKLLDVMHTFKKGHRIMIQVQSSWFPIADRNPQKWVDNIYEADEADFIKATHRVFLSPPYQSKIKVGILPIN